MVCSFGSVTIVAYHNDICCSCLSVKLILLPFCLTAMKHGSHILTSPHDSDAFPEPQYLQTSLISGGKLSLSAITHAAQILPFDFFLICTLEMRPDSSRKTSSFLTCFAVMARKFVRSGSVIGRLFIQQREMTIE